MLACNAKKHYTRRMKNKRPKNNIEIVNDYMQFGSAMNQVFLIDALNKHAERIVKNQEQVREQMKDSFIHPEAWIECAKNWQKHCKEQYGE